MIRGRTLGYLANPGKTTSSGSGQSVPLGVLIELLAALLASGAAIPTALVTLGDAIGENDGQELRSVGRSLLLGSSWNEAWRDCPQEYEVIERTLVHAWEFGAPVSHSLRSVRIAEEKAQEAYALERAEKLGVQLALPLGLCFLPSFILLAVVPIIAMMAGSFM